MISTLEDMHIWAPALATGKLLGPAMQAQRLETLNKPGEPPGRTDTDWGSSTSPDGSVTAEACRAMRRSAVYLPDKQITLVILINTDILPGQ